MQMCIDVEGIIKLKESHIHNIRKLIYLQLHTIYIHIRTYAHADIHIYASCHVCKACFEIFGVKTERRRFVTRRRWPQYALCWIFSCTLLFCSLIFTYKGLLWIFSLYICLVQVSFHISRSHLSYCTSYLSGVNDYEPLFLWFLSPAGFFYESPFFVFFSYKFLLHKSLSTYMVLSLMFLLHGWVCTIGL